MSRTDDAVETAEDHADTLSSVREYTFSETLLDVHIHFHIIDLGKQLYVWVATDAAKMGNLYVTGVDFQVVKQCSRFNEGSSLEPVSRKRRRLSRRCCLEVLPALPSLWPSG